MIRCRNCDLSPELELRTRIDQKMFNKIVTTAVFCPVCTVGVIDTLSVHADINQESSQMQEIKKMHSETTTFRYMHQSLKEYHEIDASFF